MRAASNRKPVSCTLGPDSSLASMGGRVLCRQGPYLHRAAGSLPAARPDRACAVQIGPTSMQPTAGRLPASPKQARVAASAKGAYPPRTATQNQPDTRTATETGAQTGPGKETVTEPGTETGPGEGAGRSRTGSTRRNTWRMWGGPRCALLGRGGASGAGGKLSASN